MSRATDTTRPKAAADLEWSRLLAALAQYCAGATGAARLRALEPSESIALAQERYSRSAAALEALALAEPVPGQAIPDVDETVAHVERGGVASPEQLAEVERVLAAAKALRAYATARRHDVPKLATVLASEPSLDQLLTKVGRAIEHGGHISDAASTELRSARNRVRNVRKSLLDKLAQLGHRFNDVLRDGNHVERDGRYGLAVRADAHRHVEGIVLGSSSTGATLYVEPPAVTGLTNKLRIAECDVEREEAKVLAMLSEALREQLQPFAQAYDTCIEADVLSALSRWAQTCRGIAIAPDEGDAIELRGMRHPLLVLQDKVVANDITLNAGAALVISGPNAGGKTVALKCLGLAVWMARSGIPLPLQEGSRIGWFKTVLTDIGDDQSLERSLSTFSAHVSNLVRILEHADDSTLVLLDEVAGGTDPDEGSALAAAVLEALVSRGAAVAATTHYERLKDLAAQDERFDNASVGFDFDAMQPTFLLTLGIPGASSALAVASRFAMPAAVVERAQSLMSEPSLEREELLARLQREQHAAEAARRAAEQDAAKAAALRREIEVQRQDVRQKERRKLEREHSSMMQQVRTARAELRSQLAAARDSDRDTLRKAERAIDEAAKVVAVGAPIDRATRRQPQGLAEQPQKLTVGMEVWVERLSTIAQIVEPADRGEVKVQAGLLAMRVPVSELRVPRRQSPKRKLETKPTTARTPPQAKPFRTSHNTCDLRGQRVDEALMALDRFVDDLSRAHGDEAGFVLHGHGTGALKQAVREYLVDSERIADARAAEQNEGGDAFTVFWLRS